MAGQSVSDKIIPLHYSPASLSAFVYFLSFPSNQSACAYMLTLSANHLSAVPTPARNEIEPKRCGEP